MLLLSILLLFVAVGLLAAVFVTGQIALAWASVGVSVLVALLLVVRHRVAARPRRRAEPARAGASPVAAPALSDGAQTDGAWADAAESEPVQSEAARAEAQAGEKSSANTTDATDIPDTADAVDTAAVDTADGAAEPVGSGSAERPAAAAAPAVGSLDAADDPVTQAGSQAGTANAAGNAKTGAGAGEQPVLTGAAANPAGTDPALDPVVNSSAGDPVTAGSSAAEPAAEQAAEQVAGASAAGATDEQAPNGSVTGSGHDEDAEPDEEDTDAADHLLVWEMKDEVLVVDEHPRYHVSGCEWPDSARTEGLPVREARELGFTPCALCRPDRTLARRHRAGRVTTPES